jgi:hypothetical protein
MYRRVNLHILTLQIIQIIKGGAIGLVLCSLYAGENWWGIRVEWILGRYR